MQPLISSQVLRTGHINQVSRVILLALEDLRPESRSELEDTLNRKLFFSILRAMHSLQAPNSPPSYEGRNLPSPDHERHAPREDKRPDFYWPIYDNNATDPERGVISFVFECKRLGTPPSPDWVLNRNYVRNGIKRFTDPLYGYARDDDTAAMIGYMQSMEPDAILAEVNRTASLDGVPIIDPPNLGWILDGTSQLVHALTRPEGVSPITLHHFWVDLRRRQSGVEGSA